MKKVRIFLDLDGVLANFTKAACKHFQVNYPIQERRLFTNWLTKVGGIAKTEVDNLMNNYEYWYNMEQYSYTKDLVELCKELADEVYILSKPMNHEFCYAAKINWCIDTLGLNRKQLIITEAPKHLLAHDYTDILIDDKVEMIEKWIIAGGEGYWWQELVENEHTDTLAKYRFKKLTEIVNKAKNFIIKENEKSFN